MGAPKDTWPWVQCTGKFKLSFAKREPVVSDHGEEEIEISPKEAGQTLFLGESAAATADGDDHSESESSGEEASVSAAKRKLDLGIPKWIIGDSSSSGGSDSSASSSTDSDAGSEYPSDDTADSSSPGDSDCDSGGESQEELTGYRLVDLGCLQTIVSDACICNVCKSWQFDCQGNSSCWPGYFNFVDL